MHTLLPSTEADLPELEAWSISDIDSFHVTIDPLFWLTGSNSFLALKVTDDEGDVLFVRFDREDSGLRMHTQFAPLETVSKKRVVSAILGTLPAFIEKAKTEGLTHITFMTTFPQLAAWMQLTLGFRLVEGTDDYKLKF
jgi:hypothetical protein